MSSDNQNNPTLTMDAKIAKASLDRYFQKNNIALPSRKVKLSAVNTLQSLGALKHFSDPETFFDTIKIAFYKKRGVDTQYSDTQIANFSKTMSKVAQHLTDEEKVQILNHYYDSKTDHNSKYKRMRHNDKQKLDAFKVLIEDEYKGFNGARSMEYAEGNVPQKMNERQTRAYQVYDILLDKLVKLLGEYANKDLSNAQVLYEFQFLVADLIYLLGERNRRLDISDTWINDGEGRNVVLTDDGIMIKVTRKKKEPMVLIPFKDERLKKAVKMLVYERVKSGKSQLFLKKDGDKSPNQEKWFAESFKKTMKKLGVGNNLTMGVFRMSVAIKLSQGHDNTLASEKRIEDIMGHSWSTHQRRYNLTQLEHLNENMNMDAETDTEEE